jgi:hypothetical protein
VFGVQRFRVRGVSGFRGLGLSVEGFRIKEVKGLRV